MTFEDQVRAYEDAKHDYDKRARKWLAALEPRPVTEGDFKAAERRYAIEHPEEAAGLEAVASEVHIARAALERRWIEAHEDLAVLRKAGSRS